MSAVSAVSGRIGASGKPLVITGALVLVVMSMVIPIPAALLDVGIALSIATATLILVMASVVTRPTDFQAFPVMLLISLLIRLSLNVSSTRLILTEGHTGPDAAGEVISGFSEFVAGGSLMVGITVFAVISIVNFMVITKGSGRMAEVSARFALDSLPGKQLAIDGDLNSGAIAHDEAKRRRLQDQREISFYGSLDGASKFVKGDAIAGLLITAVNFFVGLGVGLIAHGMPASEALSTYSQLTIGDGLVSQVPALITSMAAALLLSRGGATETTAGLMSTEFVRSWQPAAMVAAAMVVISLVPGMPKPLFLGIAAGMGFMAWRIAQKRRIAAEALPDLPLGDSAINAHLLQYDSVHGHFPEEVKVDGESLWIKGDRIAVSAIRNPAELPWKTHQVDVVLECTGLFTERDKAAAHLTAGARKVLISAPAKGADATVVYGVNEQVLTPDMQIISNASCTTNCLAPVVKVIHENIGIRHGSITTIHDVTNTQTIVDRPAKDMRRARSAASSPATRARSSRARAAESRDRSRPIEL